VFEENLNPPLDTFDENEKITNPQSRRDEEFKKKKSQYITKPIPKHLKSSFYVAIRVERRFVELQVALPITF